MANNIDERIVEARFDSSQFEKGVTRTIDKLDELKKALTMKDTGKGITDFAKTASDGVGKVTETLDRLSQRLTTFKGMVKQEILGTLAKQVSNTVMSIERSIAGLVNQLGSQQMHAGMAKYNDLLTSVRTLTVSGIDEALAYKQIDRLQKYSDQTNASLESMMGLVTKIKTSGASLETAGKMVEGFSNAAASLGVNMSYLPNLYLNFAQAYGKGSMKLEDWKTFQSFNMVGEQFRDKILEAAVAVGTLEKQQNGLYKTSKKTDKAIKSSKAFSADQWETYLSTGFFNKQVMDKVFGDYYYFEEIEEDKLQLIKKMTDEERKTYFEENGLDEWAYKAFKAGQEARSLTDVLNTLKNAISTGWSNTFELIFGKLDKATEFFTWLSDNELVSVIRSIGDFRNEVLTAWGADFGEGGLFMGGKTGRDYLLKSLYDIDDAIGSIHETLGSLGLSEYNGQLRRYMTVPETIGRKLGYASKTFSEYTEKVKNGVQELASSIMETYTIERKIDDETTIRVLKPEYAAKIEKVKNGITSIFGILSKLAKILTETIGKVFVKLLPVFEAVIDALGSFVQPITDLNNNSGIFDTISKGIDNLLIAVQPLLNIAQPIIRLIGEIAGMLLRSSINSITSTIEIIAEVISFVVELLGGTDNQKAKDGAKVVESWSEKIKAFGDVCSNALKTVKDFFHNLFEDIKNLLGIGGRTAKDGGAFENLSKFFNTSTFIKQAKEWINQAIKNIGDWIKDIPNKFSNLMTNIGDFIHGIFYMKDADGNEIETPFKKWLSEAFNNIVTLVGDWVKSLPGKIHQFAVNIGEFVHRFFYMKDADGNEIKTPFYAWLSDTFHNIVTWVLDWVKSLPGKIKDFAVNIGDFVHGFFYMKDADGNEIKTPFFSWLSDTFTNIVAWVGDWIRDLPGKIKDFAVNIGNFVHGFFYMKDADGNEIKTPFFAWLSDTFTNIVTWVGDWVKSLPGKIKDFAVNIGDFVHGFFYMKDADGNEIKTPFFAWLSDTFHNIVTWVLDWVKDLPNKIKDFAVNIGNFIHGFFYVKDENGNEIETPFKKWLSNMFNNIVAWIREWIEDFPNKIKNLAINIGNFVRGIFYTKDENGNEIQTPFNKWLRNTGKNILEWLKNLPANLMKVIKKAGNIGAKIWNAIDEFVFGKKVKKIKNINGQDVEYTERLKSRFVEIIENAVKSIGEWITSLPSKIGNIWNKIIDMIFGKKVDSEPESPIAAFLRSAGEKIKGAYDTVAGWPIWESIGKFLTSTGAWIKEKAGVVADWFTVPINENGETAFSKWISNVADKLKAAYDSFVNWGVWKDIGKFLTSVGDWVKDRAETLVDWFTVPVNEDGETAFSQWIANVAGKIRAAYNRIASWQIWKTIGKFLTSIGDWIKEKAGVVVDWFTVPVNGDGETAFSQWIANVAGKIRAAYNRVASWQIWKTIGKFITDVGDWIKAKAGIVVDWFTAPVNEEGETGFSQWITNVAKKIRDVYNQIVEWPVWSLIGQFISDTFHWIVGLFNGENKKSEGDTEEDFEIDESGLIDQINENTKEFSDKAKEADGNVSEASNVFGSLLESIAGFFERVAPSLKDMHFDESISTFLTGAGQLLSTLFDAFGKFFEHLAAAISGSYVGQKYDENGNVIFEGVKGTEAAWADVKEVFDVVWQILKEIIGMYAAKKGVETGFGVVQGVLGKLLNTRFDSIGSEIRDIGIGVFALAGAIAALKAFNVSVDEVKEYGWLLVGMIGVVSILTSAIGGAVAKAKNAGGAEGIDWEKILSKLISTLAIVGIIWIVVDHLPTIIAAFADARAKLKESGASDENLGEDIMYMMLGIAGLLTSAAAIAAIFSHIQKTSPTGLSPVATAKTMGSVLVVLGSVILVVNAIEAINKFMSDHGLSDSKTSTYDGLIHVGESIAALLTSLGKGFGGFADALTHGGLTPEERQKLSLDATKSLTEIILELNSNMPSDELEKVLSMVERMVGIHERLQAISAKAEDVAVLVSANDVADTFRTVTESILSILTAFDLGFESLDPEKNDSAKSVFNILGIWTGKSEDTKRYLGSMDKGIAEHYLQADFSVWESFTKGGSAYEVIMKFIDMYTAIIESLDSAALPNLYKVMTLDDDAWKAYWNRLSTFFRQEETGTASFYAIIKMAADAYSLFERWISDDLTYVDSVSGETKDLKFIDGMEQKYVNAITSVNAIFGIMNNIVTESMNDLLSSGKTTFGNYWERFSEFFLPEETGTSSFYAIVKAAIDGYTTLERCYDQLAPYANAKYDRLFDVINNLFGMFIGNGIGSEEWDKNFATFAAKMKSPEFIREYIGSIEKVFEALKTSSLFDPDTGFMKNIYFDGSSLVSGLFNAINDGLSSPDLPSLDASAVGDAILKAIIQSADELKIAKEVHKMIQEGLLVFSDRTELGEYDLSQYTSELQGITDTVMQLGGEGTNVMSLLSDPEQMEGLTQSLEGIGGMISIESLLGEKPEDFVNHLQGTFDSAFTKIDPLTNEATTYFSEMSGVLSVDMLLGKSPEEFAAEVQKMFKDAFSTDVIYTIGKTAGENLDLGLAAGIDSGNALAAAKALARGISGSFTVSWVMRSPSKLFEEFGEYLDLGLARGIDDNSDSPIGAAESMAEDSVSSVRSILEGIRDLAIDEMDITPTITPVVDMSNVNAAAIAIRGMGFGGLPFTFDTTGMNMNAQIANPDYGRVDTVQNDYTSIISSIRGDIASLGTQVAQLNDSMNSMRVVLDTGAVVGGLISEIDSSLGRRGFYAGREG